MEAMEGLRRPVGRRPKAEHFYFTAPVAISCDRTDCLWQDALPSNATLAELQRRVAAHKHLAAT